jgi:hypothetical protein
MRFITKKHYSNLIILIEILLAIVALGGPLLIALSPMSPQSTQSLNVTAIALVTFICGALVIIIDKLRAHFERQAKAREALETLQQMLRQANEAAQQAERERQAKLRHLISLLWKERQRHALSRDHVRACIFLLDPDITKNELYLYCYSGAFDDDERNVRFAERQGVVGFVFWDFGDVLPVQVDPADLFRAWRLTQDQISATHHVKSIFAVPILDHRDASRNTIIGVFTLDSTQSLHDVGWDNLSLVTRLMNLVNDPNDHLAQWINPSAYRSQPRVRNQP